jgi:chloramphenicol-sensitive protein RarD
MNITSAHVAAILAFSLWGLFPLYWKIFTNVGSWDLFGHRLLWSFLTLALIMLAKKKFGTLKEIWKNKKVRYMLMLSSLLISTNWLLYIYAVSINKVLEASMGYFLNPLINIFMGWLVLKEEIRKTQWPAIILAVIAIIIMAVQSDLSSFPWLALTLSLTFALYGLVRKVTEVGSMEGLTFETFFMAILVLIYWQTLDTTPLTVFGELPIWKIVVLSLSGAVTCLPLILFAYSAKRLKLQTLGFIQYLSPSLKFLCGLVILHEPLSQDRLMAFFLIWIALAWYTVESVIFVKKNYKKKLPLSK